MLHQFEIDRSKRKPIAAASVKYFTQNAAIVAQLAGVVQAQQTFVFQIHHSANSDKERSGPLFDRKQTF
jgi:hypothetical protein